jgi:hypothetical protein
MSKASRRRRFAVPLALLVLATALHAHDFWVEPSSFRPAVGERVSFDLLVGQKLSGESVARDSGKIAHFFVRGPDGKDEDVLGIDGRSPAGQWRVRAGGFHVLGYRTTPTPIELEALKFEVYLREEGLQPVIDARKARGETGAPGREIYSRSAKALLYCGPAEKDGAPKDATAAKGFDTVIGLRLEIVPEVDPYRLAVGGELPLRVVFDGKPLAGALVGLAAQGAPGEERRVRTDADGRVRFKVAHGGVHLARVCWMVPAPKESGADWESTWGSLTFEIPTAKPAAPSK